MAPSPEEDGGSSALTPRRSEESSAIVESNRVASERADLWKSEGNSRLVAGDLQGALNSYGRGLEAAQQAKVGPKLLSQLHTNRAQVHIRMGNHAEALEDCEAALLHDPSNGKAYWRGATAALRLDQAEASAAICMRGIKAVGDSAGLSVLLEEAIARQKALVTAAEEQTESLDKDGDAGQELAERAASLLEAYRETDEASRKEDDLRRAIRLFQAGLQEDPSNELALVSLGEILDDGLGVPKDPMGARTLWLQAAKAGSQRAEMKLCVQTLGLWAADARRAALGGGEQGQPQQGYDEPSVKPTS
eukprot:TRINITY_DN105883_c0_g1_i1.p1 TRINITY_DN105883_c0_g1~~TRINITY_DN105883_c0_g1_i1.p1  ORF type:complete len:314 (-),score=80.12 TRINITY_DN105883_c0_g1_i1:27-941(-)